MHCAAIQDLEAALKRFPNNARLLTSTAVLHGRQNSVRQARQFFKRGRAVDPHNAILLRVRFLDCREGLAEVPMPILEGSHAIRARAPQEHDYLCRSQLVIPKESLVLRLPPQNVALPSLFDTSLAAVVLQAWATMEGQKGDHALADDLFQAAAKLEPGNAILLNAWATFRKKSRGDAAGAHQMYADAVSANPDDIHSLQVSTSSKIPALSLTARSLGLPYRICTRH